jgi:hypothetical protein
MQYLENGLYGRCFPHTRLKNMIGRLVVHMEQKNQGVLQRAIWNHQSSLHGQKRANLTHTQRRALTLTTSLLPSAPSTT